MAVLKYRSADGSWKEISGGGSGDSQWEKDSSGKVLKPSSNSVKRIKVPDLANVSPLGDSYTLADVKNLLNTILASLKA